MRSGSNEVLTLLRQINADLAALAPDRICHADSRIKELQGADLHGAGALLRVAQELSIRANQFWETRQAQVLAASQRSELAPNAHNLIG